LIRRIAGTAAARSGTIPTLNTFPRAAALCARGIIRGKGDMRFFLGLVVGVFMTIGLVYLSDAAVSGPGGTQVDQRPMVNWDVVDKNWQSLTHGLRNTWNKLAAAR